MDFFSLHDTRNKVGIITPWSLIHFLSGLNGYILLNRLNIDPFYNYIILLYIHSLYEIKDYVLSYYVKSHDAWGNNSLINGITDTILFLLGIIAAIKIKDSVLIPLVSIIIYAYIFSNKEYG